MFEAVNLTERRNVLGDWLIRGALGVVFIGFGWEKFPTSPGSEWVRIFQQIGLGQWFRYFTLLIPWTVPIGLALLASAMLGAIVTWLFIIGPPMNAIFPGIFLAGLIALYAGRRG